MNCWHCNTELIWGGDHDIDEEDDTWSMVTNLSCPTCNCHVDVYLPKDDEEIDHYQEETYASYVANESTTTRGGDA